MRFSIERDALLEAIQSVQSVVEKKSTVQILSNLLCEIGEGKLHLSATDLEVGMKLSIPVTDPQEGRITLSAKNFLDIVKELPSQTIHIQRKSNDWVEIVCGKAKFNVVSLPAEEYPSLPEFESKEYLEARTMALSEMIDKTSFAVSTDATRYHLNGVYLEPIEEAGIMRMTATDGHRLSFVETEVFKESPLLRRGVIIPKKGLGELRKLLDQSGDTVRIAFDRGYFFAATEGAYLFVKMIEGEYPDVRQVIPSSTKNLALIDREALVSALRRVSLLAHEKSRGVKLNFKPGVLSISSSNPDMGDATEEFEMNYEGDEVEIGFNARYLLDCLPVISAESIEFHFNDRLNPGVVKGVDQKNHTYVVMPMRI